MPPLMTIVTYAAAVILSYLLGSIPVGLIVVRLISGQDIRQVGSGRTGGTNAFRAAGLPAGILTAFGDIGKGFASIYLAKLLAGSAVPLLEAFCGIAAVAGHNWPIFLNFKGGAGTGPNVGAATAIWPVILPIQIVMVSLTLYFVGYASVASTLAGVVIMVVFFIRWLAVGAPLEYAFMGLVTLILTAIALIPNYKRLAAGTERRVGRNAKINRQQAEHK